MNDQTEIESIENITILSGLEIVRAIAAGRISAPPMVGIMPLSIVAVTEGSVELAAAPHPRFNNLMRILHGGWSMTMIDTVAGLAALTTLKPGQISPTLDTSVKFLKPITERTGEVKIVGKVISRGQNVVTVLGHIADQTGRILAHGTSSCLIQSPRR